ncbi:hypothetical protein SPHV1_850003 [Novosphingobium sp. KN65.2]|nr:hypothetical protein SPHV1_850003 [Novosphingobium sp. KN65.2]
MPTGVALLPAEFIPCPPRNVAERTYNITRWQPMSAVDDLPHGRSRSPSRVRYVVFPFPQARSP